MLRLFPQRVIFRQDPGDVGKVHIVNVAILAGVRLTAVDDGRSVDRQVAAIVEGKQGVELAGNGRCGDQYDTLCVLPAPWLKFDVQANGALYRNGAIARGGNAEQVGGDLSEVVFREKTFDIQGAKSVGLRPGS